MATPTSATPTTSGISPNSDVIITDESEVFTEGATVEIVETTPLSVPPPKSPKKKGAPAYRGKLLHKYVCFQVNFGGFSLFVTFALQNFVLRIFTHDTLRNSSLFI